jgi:uncharacterized protein involved in exopolysaccharide biosynthesis
MTGSAQGLQGDGTTGVVGLKSSSPDETAVAPNLRSVQMQEPFHGDAGILDGDKPLKILDVVNLVLRNRWVVLVPPFVLASIVGLIVLLLPRTFTANLYIMPQAPAPGTAALTGLAAQFGVSLAGSAGAQSPNFYSELIASPAFLEGLIYSSHAYSANGASKAENLLTALSIDGSSPGDRLRNATAELLDEVLQIDPDAATSLLKIGVRTHNASLSAAIGRHIAASIDRFNAEAARTLASATRDFAGNQLLLADSSLRGAEDRAEAFLRANRSYQADPQLVFQFERLQREIGMRQAVSTSLRQQYEQARIETARATPSIIIVNPPVEPVYPDRRHLLLKIFLGFAIGGLIGLAMAFGRELMRQEVALKSTEYAEFRTLWSLFMRDVKHVGQLLTGRGRQKSSSSTP